MPPLIKSLPTGIGGRPEVMADCLSRISFTAAGVLRNTQFSHPICTCTSSPYSSAHALSCFCGCGPSWSVLPTDNSRRLVNTHLNQVYRPTNLVECPSVLGHDEGLEVPVVYGSLHIRLSTDKLEDPRMQMQESLTGMRTTL